MCVVCVPCCCMSVLNYCSPSCFATQPGQGATTYINGMCCEMYHSACSQSACLHSVCDTYSLLTMLCMVCVFVLALSLSLSGQGISTKVSIRMASRMDKAASHMWRKICTSSTMASSNRASIMAAGCIAIATVRKYEWYHMMDECLSPCLHLWVYMFLCSCSCVHAPMCVSVCIYRVLWV